MFRGMGYKITWCAVPENSADVFLTELGLSATDRTEEHPNSPVVMASLDTGWRLIYWRGHGEESVSDDRLAELSRSCEVIRVLVSETVMASSAESWRGGLRAWWISHEGDEDANRIDVAGKVPACYDEIRARLAKEQADDEEGGVDFIFDVPIEVAKQVVGYRHDEGSEQLVGGRFTVMNAPARPGFFARLFGR
jgi:hypothetical protein